MASTETKTPASPELLGKIKKQVEFYFSDHNLPRDNFLKQQLQVHEGWVPINVLLTFKRLQNLTTDFDTVVAGIKTSENLLTVSEDGKKVKRKVPLKPVDEDAAIYLKAFTKDTTLDQVHGYLSSQKIQGVCAVRMRRYRNNMPDETLNGAFKGSVFVAFNNADEAKAAVEALKGSKYGEDQDVEVMLKSAYLQTKETERRNRKRAREPEDERPIPRDCLIRFTELAEDTSREDISELLTGLEVKQEEAKEGEEKKEGEGEGETPKTEVKVAFVDFSRGATEGTVRLHETSMGATAVVALLEGKQLVGAPVKASVISGDAETQYWTDLRSAQKQRRSKGNKRRRR